MFVSFSVPDAPVAAAPFENCAEYSAGTAPPLEKGLLIVPVKTTVLPSAAAIPAVPDASFSPDRGGYFVAISLNRLLQEKNTKTRKPK